MSTIRVERRHSFSEPEALEKAKELVGQFAGRLNADVRWDGTRASFKGKGFSGSASVTADNVAVDVDLSLLLRPMKGSIEARLEQELNAKFA